jgi:hypothetical protein
MRIVQIPKNPAIGWACLNTGRLIVSLINAVRTKGALLHGPCHVVLLVEGLLEGRELLAKLPLYLLHKTQCPIRAGSNTGTAPATFLLIYQDNSILPLMNSLGGAGLHTGGVLTVVAEGG